MRKPASAPSLGRRQPSRLRPSPSRRHYQNTTRHTASTLSRSSQTSVRPPLSMSSQSGPVAALGFNTSTTCRGRSRRHGRPAGRRRDAVATPPAPSPPRPSGRTAIPPPCRLETPGHESGRCPVAYPTLPSHGQSPQRRVAGGWPAPAGTSAGGGWSACRP